MSKICTLYELNMEYGPNWFPIGPEDIPLQYTGVKDLQGCDIYEGDIVLRAPFVSPGFENWVSPYPGLVEFYEDKFLISRHPNSHEFDCRYPLKKSKVKVIGNIYENPELIQ